MNGIFTGDVNSASPCRSAASRNPAGTRSRTSPIPMQSAATGTATRSRTSRSHARRVRRRRPVVRTSSPARRNGTGSFSSTAATGHVCRPRRGEGRIRSPDAPLPCSPNGEDRTRAPARPGGTRLRADPAATLRSVGSGSCDPAPSAPPRSVGQAGGNGRRGCGSSAVRGGADDPAASCETTDSTDPGPGVPERAAGRFGHYVHTPCESCSTGATRLGVPNHRRGTWGQRSPTFCWRP